MYGSELVERGARMLEVPIVKPINIGLACPELRVSLYNTIVRLSLG
jgi:hypothetical protein